MIRQLGFDYVHEVSFGVDLIAAEYANLFTKAEGKYMITANCPSIVNLIEKFHPELVPNLAPLVSPMIATAMVVKELYGADAATVQIGPCLDAKDEALIYDSGKLVDGVLTFMELRQFFDEFKIQERLVKMSDFDPPHGTGEHSLSSSCRNYPGRRNKTRYGIQQCNNSFRQRGRYGSD